MDQLFFIPGPSGNIESLATPGQETPQTITAILCHPHPLFGGTMHNKVITTLMQSCRDLGIDTLRFNFRGVGQSEGIYDSGEGELDDCLAVINWVRTHQPEHTILLAGFSFGGCIAMRAAAKAPTKALITISPAVAKLTAPVPFIDCPWIMIQGDQDETVNPESVYQFVARRSEKINLIRLIDSSHFFHGQLTLLKQQLTLALVNSGILA